jgi:hypothetical protein
MLTAIYDLLFGCRHSHYSFPITTRKRTASTSEAARVTGTYVVCLDCGREFPYDWQRMKMITSSPAPVQRLPLKTVPAGGISKAA